ncbi:MAG: FAD-dependent oxidoreductase [Caldilineaceae bacterium]
MLRDRAGVELARGGKVPVTPDLSIPNHPNIFVVGDIAHFEQDGKPLPGLAPVAMQQGAHAAIQCLCRFVGGQATPALPLSDRASWPPSVRRCRADLYLVRLSGLAAWLVWLFIHLMYLVGFRNRLIVFVEWMWNYVTFRRGVRLIVSREWGLGLGIGDQGLISMAS